VSFHYASSILFTHYDFRWVEGALDSAYVAVDKMLLGTGRTDLQEKLKKRWANPNIAEDQRKEIEEMFNLQEIMGAMLSAFGDLDNLKNVLKVANKAIKLVESVEVEVEVESESGENSSQ
jgi:hypothetical protein